MRPFSPLGGLMAGKVGSADAAKPVTSERMAAKTVGLQIYSLGKELYADVPIIKRSSKWGTRIWNWPVTRKARSAV